MRSRFRPSHAVVVAYLALFVALGGTATAVTYVVSSNSQVGPGTISGDAPPTGKHANIIPNSITGKDIANRSGVDTCPTPLTKKFGPICAGSPGVAKKFADALGYCTDLGLRLPSLSEGIALAKKFDVPGVSFPQNFWTEQTFAGSVEDGDWVVTAGGGYGTAPQNASNQTVCVTDPSA